MEKILLIINPAAGRSGAKIKTFPIADWFRKKGCDPTVRITAKKGDATDFAKQYAGGNDAVVCCGGDGTLNEVISGVMQAAADKPIGYLPTGTTNDMAKTLQLPTNLKKAARVVLNGKPVYQDVGLLNQTQFFTYIASFGAFTKVSYATPQWLKNRFGHFAYVVDGIKSVGEIHPYRAKVVSDEWEEEGDFLFGSVTNSSSVGGVLNFRSADICLNDGEFEVLLIRNPQNLLEFNRMLHNLRRHKSDPNLLFFHTRRIVFQFKKQTDWTVDGEYGGGLDKAEIKNLHNAVRIIRRK